MYFFCWMDNYGYLLSPSLSVSVSISISITTSILVLDIPWLLFYVISFYFISFYFIMILVCIALFWFALFLQLCDSLNCFAISCLDYCTNFCLTVNYFFNEFTKKKQNTKELNANNSYIILGLYACILFKRTYNTCLLYRNLKLSTCFLLFLRYLSRLT